MSAISSTVERRLISTEKVKPRYRFSGSRDGAVHHGVVLYLFSNCNKTSLCSASSSPPRQKEKGSRISLRFTATTTTTTRWASYEEMQSYRFFPVTAARRVPALSARMEIRSASPRSSSFTPSIRRARRIPRLKRVEEDFYLRRRKQIPFEIFISVGIMLRGRQTTLPGLFRIALFVSILE